MAQTRGELGSGGIRRLLGFAGRKAAADAFRNPWPNTPDFTFSYADLMKLDGNSAIAQVPARAAGKRIAIIGAGVAGLAAARELRRCGFASIDIFEASGRIGGRTYSQLAYENPAESGYTTFELGAMRFPLFEGNSLMDYYLREFGIGTQPFPDPGTVDTGIWINQGRGVNGRHADAPDIDLWEGGPAPNPPPHDYVGLHEKWTAFATMFTEAVSQKYAQGDSVWMPYWQEIVNSYRQLTFLEFTRLPAQRAPDGKGYFGGLGMTAEEARLFYTIGAGDGSWGAFYAVSALYPIRTLLCGFGDDHRLVQGTFGTGGFEPGPRCGLRSTDSLQQDFPGPNYLGIQSLAECLLYRQMGTSAGVLPSLYDQLRPASADGVHLFMQTPVIGAERNEAAVQLAFRTPHGGSMTKEYEIVISTPTTWASQLSYPDVFSWLPQSVWDAFHVSHWITSCKVFYALKDIYWKSGSRIPQIIVSDTMLQDSYGYALDVPGKALGILLVSYTWEDDALKLIADAGDDAGLARRALQELARITRTAASIREDITDYVDESSSAVIHWMSEPDYRGCAKLYRPGSEFENYTLLAYNQNFGRTHQLYLAGEAFSVYGGWTEPALRHGLDAVVNILNDVGADFKKGFSYSDYPQYGPNPYAEA